MLFRSRARRCINSAPSDWLLISLSWLLYSWLVCSGHDAGLWHLATHSHSLTHSPLTHSLTHSPSHSLTPLTHSHSLTLTHSLSLTRSLSLTHSPSLTHSLSHPSLTHTTLTSLTHTLTHSPVSHSLTCACTYTHTNSPTITPPSLSYFLFPSCFSMLSLSLEKLVTCGVIRSFFFRISQDIMAWGSQIQYLEFPVCRKLPPTVLVAIAMNCM